MFFAKLLLYRKAKKAYENIIAKLTVSRVIITVPENHSSSDSDYSYIEASATSASGSRYIYVYPTEEHKAVFEGGNINITSKPSLLTVSQYGSTYGRFAIGNLANVSTGIYKIYCYNTLTEKNIYEITLNWTNNT